MNNRKKNTVYDELCNLKQKKKKCKYKNFAQ